MNNNNYKNKMSLDEGLNTLRSIFPNMEEDVIISVLEENEYKMEASIECLLNLQSNFDNVAKNTDNTGNIMTNLPNQSNNNEKIEKEEKILSLFANLDTDNHYKQNKNLNENFVDNELIHKICKEKNIPLSDTELIKYYLNNPEFLNTDKELPKSRNESLKKNDNVKTNISKSFGMSDDLKKDVTKFDSNDGEKNNKNLKNNSINEDDKSKKNKGFGNKFKNWLNDIFKKDEKMSDQYEKISGHDELETKKKNNK